MNRNMQPKTLMGGFKQWLDTIDFELIFLNALIIAILVIVIMATELLIS